MTALVNFQSNGWLRWNHISLLVHNWSETSIPKPVFSCQSFLLEKFFKPGSRSLALLSGQRINEVNGLIFLSRSRKLLACDEYEIACICLESALAIEIACMIQLAR